MSVPSNIAEGYGRGTTADYVRMLHIAYGSLCELETQLMIADDLSYVPTDESVDVMTNVTETERMLKALIKSLTRKISAS